MLANLNRETSFEKVGFIVDSFKPPKPLTMSPSGPTKVSDYRLSFCDEPKWKQPEWKEPQEIDQEKRMQTFLSLLSKKKWKSICKALNETSYDKFNLALTINDMPERFRNRAFEQLGCHWYHIVMDYISEVQMNKDKFDPNSGFPAAATPQFLETLPKSMQRCNVCYCGFETGEDIIQKSCGKHVLHRNCLMQLMELDELPIHGLCDCNTAGHGPAGWRKALSTRL
jgi:hypothetical protein